MRTVEFQHILNHAAELAGRARGKILAEERTMLRAYLAAYLRTLWTAEAWPETLLLEERDVVDRVIDRTEGRRMVGSYTGSYAIPAGVDHGTVTFDISRTPAAVLLSVSKPAEGLGIEANPVDETLTKTGFDFTLTGITDQEGYVLNYEVMFE